MGETRFHKATEKKHVLLSNPGRFSVNDVSIGIVNTDVIKDMCINMCTKNDPNNKPTPKIDHVL